MKAINVDNLIIEVGRDCNFECEHCLRGENTANGKRRITKEIIDATLENITQISSLTLTGGEPFLYPDIIQYIADAIEAKEIELYSFFIATNGTVKATTTLASIVKLYALSEEKECCEIKISDDVYHQRERCRLDLTIDPTFDILSITRRDQTKYKPEYLINQGNAALNLNAMKNVRDDGFSISQEDDIMLVENDIYINTNGDILSGCDYSYEYQEYEKRGNVLEQPLIAFLEQVYEEEQDDAYCAKEEEYIRKLSEAITCDG